MTNLISRAAADAYRDMTKTAERQNRMSKDEQIFFLSFIRNPANRGLAPTPLADAATEALGFQISRSDIHNYRN